MEEKVQQKEKIISVVERESELASYHWVNFWRRMFEGGLSISLFFYFYFQSKNTDHEISTSIFLFSLFWVGLISGIIYLFYKINFSSNRLVKKKISQEHGFINEEVNNSILIESMGLEESYELKQQYLTQQSALQKVVVRKLVGLEMTIPWKLLINLFPFTLLIIQNNFIGASLAIIWNILNECVYAFSYLGKWSDYSSSRIRINNFLVLPERNDNLQGVKIPLSLPLREITFEQVAFKYQGKNELMNYNNAFSTDKVNYLSTPNGSGKTTQLYLLLGLLTPAKGKIIIKSKTIIFNLSEINLKHWRSKNVAFCSYKTLIKEGSTGQRQLVNLKQILESKKQAQIFIFDEADNALDKEKQVWFQVQLKKLVQEKKIVIYVKQAR